MAGTSTDNRWISIRNLVIGLYNINDVTGGSVSCSAQALGSNSEDDDWANHFLMGLMKEQRMSVNTFDVSGCTSLMDAIGTVVEIGFEIPSGTISGFGTGISVSAEGMVENVEVSAQSNSEATGTISLVFKSTTGKAAPITIS